MFGRKNKDNKTNEGDDERPFSQDQRTDSFLRGSFGLSRFSMGNFSDELASLDDDNKEDDDEQQQVKAATEAAAERQKVSDMAKQHARRATIWRRNVFILMFVVGALLTVGTYIFLEREQEQDLETSVRHMPLHTTCLTSFSCTRI